MNKPKPEYDPRTGRLLNFGDIQRWAFHNDYLWNDVCQYARNRGFDEDEEKELLLVAFLLDRCESIERDIQRMSVGIKAITTVSPEKNALGTSSPS